ncbi:hypothetical protein Tco_0715559 [Tanacetum coccineum]
MDQDSAHMVAASKVPMLKLENGNALLITKVVEGVETKIAPITAEKRHKGGQRDIKLKHKHTKCKPGGVLSNNSSAVTNESLKILLHDCAIKTCNQATAVNSTTIDNLSDAVICAFFASQQNSTQLDNEDLQQIFIR